MLPHACQSLWPEQQFLMGIKFLVKLMENNAATLEMSSVFDIRQRNIIQSSYYGSVFQIL